MDPGADGRWFCDDLEVVRDKTGERVGVAAGEREGEVEKGLVTSSMVVNDRRCESWDGDDLSSSIYAVAESPSRREGVFEVDEGGYVNRWAVVRMVGRRSAAGW